ncbi:hypothetical protein [Kosakonia cowanii]|uniref:hypothetical protein n=1 Tax=Kosakonia cowanii TaxID=208223 RepID=UPI0012EB6280|nr:hypothetical protein [Kosakonia cowanii]
MEMVTYGVILFQPLITSESGLCHAVSGYIDGNQRKSSDAAVQYIYTENSYEPLARVDSHGKHTETFWYHTARNRGINMKKINNSYISMLWQVLSEDPNMDASLVGLSLSNEKSLSLAFRELIKPSYDNFPNFIKDRCKNSLAYAINFYDEKPLSRLYESAIPLFDPPNNMSMKQFYVAAWECLFPGESCLINNPEEYVEISFNDLYTK